MFVDSVCINTVAVCCNCARIARHRLIDNGCSVFIHRISLRNEFSTNNAISKNNLQLLYQHKMTIIPILSKAATSPFDALRLLRVTVAAASPKDPLGRSMASFSRPSISYLNWHMEL